MPQFSLLTVLRVAAFGLVSTGVMVAAGQDGHQDAKSKRVDYHSVRGRASRAAATGIYEGELHFTLEGRSKVQGMEGFGPHWSGNAQLLWDDEPGKSMVTSFHVRRGSRFHVTMQLTLAPDYGQFSILLDGKQIAKRVDLYSPRVELAKLLDFGTMDLPAGKHRLEFKLMGANSKARMIRGKAYLLGLDYLRLRDLDPMETPVNPQPAPSLVELPKSLPAISWEAISRLMADRCHDCHSGDEPAGKLDLTPFSTREAFTKDLRTADRIAFALYRREMPPAGADQPVETERSAASHFFRQLVEDEVKRLPAPNVVMRRLTRYEYNNAVRDLLSLRGDVFPLPEKIIRPAGGYFDPASGDFPDAIMAGNRTLGKNQVEKHILTGVSPFAIDLPAEHGFNNRGAELSFSPILLQSFLKLSKSIVESPEFDNYSQLPERFFAAPIDKASADAIDELRKRLSPFLRRAFRKPVDDATTARYARFLLAEWSRTGDYAVAMKRVVAAVLASPRFLYLAETAATSEDLRLLGPLSQFEIATRLSFFLWSSIPDDALLDLAEQGRLSHPAVLNQQVDRMLEDPRCQSLSENFARQWLRLDRLITAVPDFERYEFYYSRIGCEQWKFGLQMMLEPLLLFESIIVEDRSVMLLVDSRYSYRSDELQSWYQDATPFGGKENRGRFNTFQQAFRKRELKNSREGGVMTTAAVMTMTSGPLRTQPIARGAWVASVMFNQPPPPPPDVVPPIEQDDAAIEAKGLTLRERLEKHQVNSACVSCHTKIDPLGFALENYDPVGRWRDTYRSGLPIDASGKLFQKSPFKDAVGLKAAMVDHPEWFMRAFSEHLLSYALGRELRVEDRGDIERIVRASEGSQGQFSKIVKAIIASRAFLSPMLDGSESH